MLQFLTQLLPAETDLAGLAGKSGWAGAGMLGLVLAWLLLVHVPALFKHLREIVADHKATEERQREVHTLLEREQRAEYREALREILAHCRREEKAPRKPEHDGSGKQ